MRKSVEHESKTHTVTYRSAPHNIVINRTSSVMTGGGTSGSFSRSSKASLGTSDLPFSEGEYSLVTARGVSEVKTSRDQEKKELQGLNERFANYLDKVRSLEAQNRKLADELEKLKARWGKETSQIKAMYQAELDEARRTLDDAEKEKARLEIKIASLEELIEELRVKLSLAQQDVTLYREKLTKQTQQISDYEIELQSLRKQLESLESEHEKDLKTIANLEDTLRRAREELDAETLAHIDAENRRQTLEEEIEFLKSIHDQEMKELAALAYRDTSQESREFWKNELSQAVREIEQMYSDKLIDLKSDLEASYNFKLQELRTGAARHSAENTKGKEECKELRAAITDLRDRINDLDAKNNQLVREIEALRREKEDRERQLESENALLRDDLTTLRSELDAVMRELQALLGTKMSLDLEIAAYRKLLDFEESRTSGKFEATNRVHSIVESTASDDLGSSGRGEMSAKTTYSRTAKGALAIADSPPDGRCVRIENNGKKDENAEGFKIQRTVDGKVQNPYTLDSRFSAIKPGQKIAIWAKGGKPQNAPATDVESEEYTWGIGSNVVTVLASPDGESRATLTQKTVYS